MLFAIDHGNSAIKTPSFVFTSGLTDYPVKPPVETDVLEFGGTFWTLSGERIPYMRDKTKDERFFILSLFAIAKELRQREALQPMVEAELAIGLPPEHYELRNRFAEYFKRGTVQFKFNDTAISLMIRQVLVYPQAYAAVVPQAQIIQQNPRTFVVDIGGFTTDVLLLRGVQPDMQFCRSLEMGAIPMANGIIGRVSALHDIKIDDDHIADVIQGRPTILPKDVQEAIRATVKSYAAGILDKLRELQVDLRATPAIFTGGGAALFRSFLESSPQVAKAEFVADPRPTLWGTVCWPPPSCARCRPRRSVKALRRDDRFRFSLQWRADTEEKARVGALIEQLGNKKSDFIVMAVMDYLQRHPDMEIPGAKIKITYQPLHTKEQLLAMVREMVKTSVGEFLSGNAAASTQSSQPPEMSLGPSEQDIDAMVASLKLFDQS